MGRTAASQAWILAASVSRTGTRFVNKAKACHNSGGFDVGRGLVVRSVLFRRWGKFVRGRRVGDGNVVVRSGSLHAPRRGVTVI
jgi:hypothetical protein